VKNLELLSIDLEHGQEKKGVKIEWKVSGIEGNVR